MREEYRKSLGYSAAQASQYFAEVRAGKHRVERKVHRLGDATWVTREPVEPTPPPPGKTPA